MYFKMINILIGLIFLNFFLFFNLKKLANFVNIFDKPDGKLKLHKMKTPIIGGNYFSF